MYCVSKHISFLQYECWSIPIFIRCALVLVLKMGIWLGWWGDCESLFGMPLAVTRVPYGSMSFRSATLELHKGALYRS